MTVTDADSLPFTLRPERPRETLTEPLCACSIIDYTTSAGCRWFVKASARLM